MLKRIVLLMVVLMMLAGCGTFVVEGSVVTPTLESTQPNLERESAAGTTETEEEPTPAPTRTIEPTPVPTQSLPSPTGAYAGWLRYLSEGYGFSFLYPSGWTVEPESEASTLYQHAIIVRPPDADTVALRIAYKRLGNDMMIGRTGVGAGELVDGGMVEFLGEPLDRQVLIGQAGQPVTVLYGHGEIERGDMVYTLNLDCGRCYEDTSGMPEGVEATVDMIIASFEQ